MLTRRTFLAAVPAGLAAPAAAGAADPPAGPKEVKLMRAGEGPHLWALGVLVTLKATAKQTGGSYSLFEDVVPPGVGPPPHIHTREEETWYLLDGELVWKVGDKEFAAKAGDFINTPRGVPHAFKNETGKVARMVLTYAPGGFEEWFHEVGTPAADPTDIRPPAVTEADIRKAVAAAEKYGVKFVKK